MRAAGMLGLAAAQALEPAMGLAMMGAEGQYVVVGAGLDMQGCGRYLVLNTSLANNVRGKPSLRVGPGIR